MQTIDGVRLTQSVEEMIPGLLSEPDSVALRHFLAISRLIGLNLATRQLVSGDLCVVG